MDSAPKIQSHTVDRDVGLAPRLRVRCFHEVNRWVNLLIRLVKALHEGCWLGLLDADDLNAVTSAYYAESSYYGSKEHTLSGFFDWEKPVLDRYFQKDSRILVAAAGAGREVLALRKAGFRADGFECGSQLLQVAEAIFDEVGESGYVISCPLDGVPPGPATYNGLIVGWSAYTHIPTRLRRVAFLQSLRQRALPRSPLLLSFFTNGPSSRYENVVYRTATFVRFLFRLREEPVRNGDRLSWNRYDHPFTRDELESELISAGFRLVHFGEDKNCGHAVGIAE
jgi:hypothetical protein